MNEHEELFEKVDDRVHGIYLLGYNREGISDSRNRIEQIIALVEQDVARRLLSGDAVEAGSDAMYITIKSEPGTYPLIYMEDVPDFPTGLRAALAAIGITVEDDQP